MADNPNQNGGTPDFDGRMTAGPDSIARITLRPIGHPLPLGFLALTLVMFLDLPRVRSGQSYLFREEGPSA